MMLADVMFIVVETEWNHLFTQQSEMLRSLLSPLFSNPKTIKKKWIHPLGLVGQTVQKLVSGRYFLIGKAGMQGQSNGGVSQVDRSNCGGGFCCI